MWADATQPYEAVITIQTGTGARTLVVYNALHPGVGEDYPRLNSNMTRLNAIFPASPTMTIAWHGYNSGLAAYRAQVSSCPARFSAPFPAQSILMSHSPHSPQDRPTRVTAYSVAHQSGRWRC
jgi:hypothetical protein